MADIIKDAEDVIDNSLNDMKLQKEADEIVASMYDEYTDELQDRWVYCLEEFEYSLEKMKSVKKKMDELGVVPKAVSDNEKANDEIIDLISKLFEYVPDEPFVEPEVYGKNHEDKSR